ncbi:uncharacterized protein PV09_09248 [Verruconis gallopava]|uniref:WLM domain-containing protein n=1 Tax=Verruconis gallopava TaxID=253628 RepID=A0A0D1YEB7_9PEZI|nr:uncharacterized protein PV09_09248 [Verruconis gallopava]KIV99021.1 hypothetical protein PV09_09248 [Verruconis gallopava]
MAAPATEDHTPQTIQPLDTSMMAEPEPRDDEREPTVCLTIHFRGRPNEFTVPADCTLSDLAEMVAQIYGIPAARQKYMVTPKEGTYKHPFPPLSATSLHNKKIVLLGTPEKEIADLQESIREAQRQMQRRRLARSGKAPAVSRRVDWKKAGEEAQYTFHAIRPLAYLPNPERSQRFLEQLANDPGIKASMRKHRFSVGLLTEMDPAMHTTHESRTLGLNRNRGEVIELRLRTDAYDGYRDYRTIRKTLCHELSHNVWGDHDRNFWDLTKQIEDEVERNDWSRGGRALGDDEFYNPHDGGVTDEDLVDEGGWTGGEFVLGGQGAGSPAEGLSRREILAKAAEERARKAKDTKDNRGPSASS